MPGLVTLLSIVRGRILDLLSHQDTTQWRKDHSPKGNQDINSLTAFLALTFFYYIMLLSLASLIRQSELISKEEGGITLERILSR